MVFGMISPFLARVHGFFLVFDVSEWLKQSLRRTLVSQRTSEMRVSSRWRCLGGAKDVPGAVQMDADPPGAF